jgi:PAS domain S-box-containing protein
MIFLPVLALLLVSGFRQYQQVMADFENDTDRLINLFVEEQVNISTQTYQLLTILSHVPAVSDLDIPQCNALLKQIHRENPEYSTIVVSDRDGLIDCCSIPIPTTIDVSDRSWFKRIKNDRDFVIDNFLISRSAEKASLPFAYPIFDSAGNVKAAIGAAFDLESYNDWFQRIDISENFRVLLTDRRNIVLYQSDSENQCLGKSLSECRGIYVPSSALGEGSFETTAKDGEERIYKFNWLQVGQENNEVCFIVSISKKKMLSAVLNPLLLQLAILALIATTTLLFAWVSGKKILLDPINALIMKTKEIKKGRWTSVAEDNNFPLELGMLSSAFDEMVVDLSEKEEALSASEEHLRVLFSHAADSIYVAGMDGHLIDINLAACKATGYSEDELLKMNVIDLDMERTSKDDLGDFYASLLPGQQAQLTTTHRAKDGSLYPVEITISRIETPGGARVMGIARDISERLELEERTRQTLKLESVGRLAGGIAHDLNNLLTPILGYGELIRRDDHVRGKTRTRVQHILKAGAGARDLVKQLLAFSRKQFLEYKPLEINRVIEEFQELIRRTIREDIEISLSLSPGLRPVLADSGQIEQVIMNLSVNAADAMPKGGTLSIATSMVDLDEGYASLHQGVHPGTYTMMSFSDTGHGMDQKIQAQVFEPFFSTKGEQGTGLGLSTVYGIVKQHNGHIWIYSEVGIGTTFKVYFPILPEGEDAQEKLFEPSASDQLLRGSETILLVEDNEQVREITYDALTEYGYAIISASGGEDALAKIALTDQAVQLLLTDVVMPGMNGKELYRSLSQDIPSLKVLYMSGYTDDIIGQHDVLAKGAQFIQKPFTIFSMLKKIRDVIDA